MLTSQTNPLAPVATKVSEDSTQISHSRESLSIGTPSISVVSEAPCVATAIEQLSEEAKLFLDGAKPTEADHKARIMTLESFSRLVSGKYPAVKLLADALFLNKLYLSSDCITSTLTSNLPDNNDTSVTAHQLSSFFESTGVCQNISTKGSGGQITLEMHVPAGGLDMQILCADLRPDPVATTVSGLVSSFPALQPLFFILRLVLNKKNLMHSTDGGISSLSLVCIIAFFLQKHDLGGSASHEFLGTLLVGCLHWIGSEFFWEKHGLTLSGGGAKFTTSKRLEVFHMALAIELPGLYGYNIGQDTTSMKDVCAACMETWSNLDGALFIRDLELKFRRSGRITYNINDSHSLLVKVISIGSDMIVQRLRVTTAMHSGALNNIGPAPLLSTTLTSSADSPSGTSNQTALTLEMRDVKRNGHKQEDDSGASRPLGNDIFSPYFLQPRHTIGASEVANTPPSAPVSNALLSSMPLPPCPPMILSRDPRSFASTIDPWSSLHTSQFMPPFSSAMPYPGVLPPHPLAIASPSGMFPPYSSVPSPLYPSSNNVTLQSKSTPNPIAMSIIYVPNQHANSLQGASGSRNKVWWPRPLPSPGSNLLHSSTSGLGLGSTKKQYRAKPSTNVAPLVSGLQSNHLTAESIVSGPAIRLHEEHLKRKLKEKKRRIDDDSSPLAKR